MAVAQDATPSIFWNIVTASGATSAALFASVYVYWRLKPFSAHKKRVSDMKALRDLVLYNADDLEDVLAALSERATCAIPSALTLHPCARQPALLCPLSGAAAPQASPGCKHAAPPTARRNALAALSKRAACAPWRRSTQPASMPRF
jgi:hypothetical protein